MTSDAHGVIRLQLGAYALDQLEGGERLAVAAHVNECLPCRTELASIASLAAPLRDVDPDRVAEPSAPPPGLLDRVLRGVRRAARQKPILPRLLAPLAAAATAVAIAGAVGYGLGSEPGAGQPAVALEPVAVRSALPAVDASANLVAHTWGTEVILTATGFAAGEPYRVAVTTADGRRLAAGEFLGTGAKPMRCNLNSAVLRGQATGFAVTDDTGRVVLASSF